MGLLVSICHTERWSNSCALLVVIGWPRIASMGGRI
jgi:hypothetical protein